MTTGTIEIPEDVRQVLDVVAVEANIARIARPLDRPLYVKTNKVLEALGGKWNRGHKGHVFPDDVDAQDALDDARETGIYIDWKKTNEFFETPPEVIHAMIQMAEVLPGALVLEPSCGKGAIARALLDAGATVSVAEKHFPYLEGAINAFIRLGLADHFDFWHGDFLAMPPVPKYDAVVMNPPFSRSQDMLHVLHAFNFLKPRGMLVSVMSPAWQYRTTTTAVSFRQRVQGLEGAWRALPDGTFKSAGTMVRSGILCLRNV